MSTRKIAGAHQEFIDNLSTSEHKSSFQDLNTITTRRAYCFQQK